jgi:hypothetical protein
MIYQVVGINKNHPKKKNQCGKDIKITAVFDKFLHNGIESRDPRYKNGAKKKTARFSRLSHDSY